MQKRNRSWFTRVDWVLLMALAATPAMFSQEPVSSQQPGESGESRDSTTEQNGSSEVAPAAGAIAARTYHASRAAQPIKVDGVLDDPAWAQAEEWDEFWEYFPGENTEPPVRTQGWILFDNDFLYIAMQASDPEPAKIRAHLMDRDDINTLTLDDHVQILFDPFDDGRRAVHLRVNPLGVQAEALNSDTEGLEDWSWDIIWSSAGRITSDGYVVELAVPLSQLRFPGGGGPQTWRFSLGRSFPRGQRHRMQSYPNDFSSSCLVCQFNRVEGFEGLKPGRSLELDPTLTSFRTDRRAPFPEGDLEQADDDVQLGLSGRWGLSSSLNLSWAIDPDFSQVEADAAQLNVNQRFALFFPERRPFFLEGVDLYSTPIQAVFTRTVADPLWGLKLTGQSGKGTFGLFVVQDEINNLILPTNQSSRLASSQDGSLDGDVLGAVARYRRDIGKGSSIGAIFTSRESDDYSNHVVGLDAFLRLRRSDSLSMQWLRTQTDYPDVLRDVQGLAENKIDGDGFRLAYQHFTRVWSWNANYRDLDPEFRVDFGFEPRVDLRSASADIGRSWWYQNKFLTQFQLGGNVSQVEDHSGTLTNRKIGLSTFLRGPRQSALFGQVWNIDELAGGLLFEDLRGGEVFFSIEPSGTISGSFDVAAEEVVDIANVRRADLLQVNPRISWKAGRRTYAQLGSSARRFDQGQGTYLDAQLSDLTLRYHFNLRSFVRLIVQYTRIERDPSQFVFPIGELDEDVFTQLLFSYKINAQTVLFAGYSDSRLGNEELNLTQADRTFFLKLGYAWLK